MKSQKMIGILYLSIAIIGGFSMGYTPITLIDIKDLSKTFINLQENLFLFKLSVLGDGIIILLELFITVLLFHFFKTTHQIWSEIAKLSRLAMAFIMAINIINYIIPLHHVINKNSPNSIFNFCIEAHFYTVYIWQVFFGIHMIALAILTCKHPKFSKILAILLFIGGLGYLLDCTINFINIKNNIVTTLTNILLGVAAISEISFAIVLLIKKSEKA